MTREQRAESREHYFDFLRVFATLAVIVIHVTSLNWKNVEICSFKWIFFALYNCLSRWAVPIFVMISGSLFLSRDVPVKKIYSKYIFRIATAFLFWSFVYAVAQYATTKNIVKTIAMFIKGRYHLWFLFMIVCLYMLIPFMKKIAESDFLTKYFLILAFIFAFLIPQSIKIISIFSNEFGTFAQKCFENFNMYFAIGYTGYFLLGYFLNKKNFSKKAERIIYFAGMCGYVATVFMTITASAIKNEHIFVFLGSMNVNVLLESIAVFVFCKQYLSKKSQLIFTLSKYSFGAYLVHDAVRMTLKFLGITGLSFNPIFSIPVISLLVFIISFLISGILNNIPILKKYIV